MRRGLRVAVLFLGIGGSWLAGAADDYVGMTQVMKETYDAWLAANKSFDSDFSTAMKALYAEQADPAFKDAFCASGQGDRLAAVKKLLADKLRAEERYFTRNRDDAQAQMEDKKNVIANQRDLETQRESEIAKSNEELAALNLLQEQLRKNLPKEGDTSVSPSVILNLNKALSDGKESIRLLQESIGRLVDAKGPQAVTLQTLESSLNRLEALKKRMAGSLQLVKAEGEYWQTFYSMRSAQLSDLCLSEPQQGPRVVK